MFLKQNLFETESLTLALVPLFCESKDRYHDLKNIVCLLVDASGISPSNFLARSPCKTLKYGCVSTSLSVCLMMHVYVNVSGVDSEFALSFVQVLLCRFISRFLQVLPSLEERWNQQENKEFLAPRVFFFVGKQWFQFNVFLTSHDCQEKNFK